MKLVLAEKPSVAQSIAKVLGAAKREDGYLEGNGYVVSWCVGHLVELAQPEVYDAKYSKWAYTRYASPLSREKSPRKKRTKSAMKQRCDGQRENTLSSLRPTSTNPTSSYSCPYPILPGQAVREYQCHNQPVYPQKSVSSQ